MSSSYVPGGYYDDGSDDEWDFYTPSQKKKQDSEGIGRIRIVYGPGHQAGLDKVDFDVKLTTDVLAWFEDIKYLQRTCKGPLVLQKIQAFYCIRPDTLELALKMFATAPDCSNPKTTSLCFQFIKALVEYAKVVQPEQKNACLNDNLRMVAFNFFHTHSNLFTMIVDVYDLKAKKTLFLPRMHELLATDKKYKEVCEIAKLLELQQHFGIHEFLVPLILQDKLSVVETYLAKAPHITTELVVFLDTWLDHSEQFGTFYDRYFAQQPIPEVNYSKLRRKTFKKLVKRFADLYGVRRELTPNLTEMDSYGMLKKLIEKKYIEQRLNDWDEFIIEQVNPNSVSLIDELINSCIDYNDYPEAAKWVNHFRVDPNKYSAHLKEFANKKRIEVAQQTTSDSKCYRVDRKKIVLVDDAVKYDEMFTFLARYRLVAFDVEWKFGETDVSLIQIASVDQIFLVDVKRLSAANIDWRKLGRKVYNNEEIIKLGFSQDGDIAVLKKNLPQLGLMYEKSNAYIDLKKLWTFMRDTFLFKFPHVDDDEDNRKEDLRKLVAITLGIPLSKDQQFSNWSKRPLTQEQMLYAASDAYCLIEIFEVFNRAAKKRGYDLTTYDFCKQLK